MWRASMVNSFFWLLLAASTSTVQTWFPWQPWRCSPTGAAVLCCSEFGCEMSYRLTDIAGIASRRDNFVNNPTSEFLRNRGLERWQACLKFPCREDNWARSYFSEFGRQLIRYSASLLSHKQILSWTRFLVLQCDVWLWRSLFRYLLDRISDNRGVEGWRVLVGFKACGKLVYSTDKIGPIRRRVVDTADSAFYDVSFVFRESTSILW